MEIRNYSDYSLQELYDLYTKLNQENNPDEAQIVYQEILRKEKDESKDKDQLASRIERLIAAFVDGIIISIPLFTILFVFFGLNGITDLMYQHAILYTITVFLIAQVIYLSINGWLLYTNGQTLGKKMMQIKIATTKDDLPKITSSYGARYLFPAFIMLFPLIGSLFAVIDLLFIFRKDKRCVHDFIAGTKVVSI